MYYLLISIFVLIFELSAHDIDVVFLDVGQGDSTIIQNGEKQFVVDVGDGDYLINSISRYVKEDNEIEYLLITHSHKDHYGSLEEFLTRYRVNNIILPVCIDPQISRVLKNYSGNTVEASFVELEYATFNINIRKNSGYRCNFKDNGNINNSSVVTVLKADSGNIVLMGDIENDMEMEIYDRYLNNFSDIKVLKAGHHCSKTSSSGDFISKLNPSVVICSYGEKNSYGHPSEELINRLESENRRVMRTIYGDISLNISKWGIIYNDR